jgi:hypothetical protein
MFNLSEASRRAHLRKRIHILKLKNHCADAARQRHGLLARVSPSSRRMAVALLVATATLATDGCTFLRPPTPAPITASPLPVPSYDLPAQCTVTYAALLDLAELARRYGKLSGVFLNALGDLTGQLDDCLSDRQGARQEGAPIGLASHV